MTKKPFVFGDRPSHVHKVDGKEIECNSPYCEYLDADPRHQEQQRPPWSEVENA